MAKELVKHKEIENAVKQLAKRWCEGVNENRLKDSIMEKYSGSILAYFQSWEAWGYTADEARETIAEMTAHHIKTGELLKMHQRSKKSDNDDKVNRFGIMETD